MAPLGHSVCSLLLALALLPTQPALCQEAPQQERLSVQLYQVTHEMWVLLSGVVDKASADAAADRFRELAEQSAGMTEKLFDEDAQGIDLEQLDQDTYRVAEAYEDLSYEFDSLCRTHCYGSSSLISAFLSAMRLGIFSDDAEDFLKMSSLILSAQDAVYEIERLHSLIEPDADLLRALCKVQNPQSASNIVPELREITQRLRRLLPDLRLSERNFAEKDRAPLLNVCRRIEPTLWKIRAEIVRIVGLPGYDNEQFDDFSDALDSVYESLRDTHAECFDGVFDASFRSDLDDALHEHDMTH